MRRRETIWPSMFGAAALAMGMMSMWKTETFKNRRGCSTCRHEDKTKSQMPCKMCEWDRGTMWECIEPPKPVYCECCGAEKQ